MAAQQNEASIQYMPDNTERPSLIQLISYFVNERVLRLGHRLIPSSTVKLGLPRVRITDFQVKNVEYNLIELLSANEELQDEGLYEKHPDSSYRRVNQHGYDRNRIPRENSCDWLFYRGTGTALSLIPVDGHDVITCRVFSNYSAVQCMHQILMGNAWVEPVSDSQDDSKGEEKEGDKDKGDKSKEWSRIRLQYYDRGPGSGVMLHMTAEHEGESSVDGFFSKSSSDARWTVENERPNLKSPTETTTWELKTTKSDPLRIYLILKGTKYIVHENIEGDGWPEVADLLGHEGGRWIRAKILNETENGLLSLVFRCSNKDDTIMDRVVIKDFLEHDQGSFRDRLITQEIKVHQKLTLEDSTYIIALRAISERTLNNRTSNSSNSRLYEEYAPFESLQFLIDRFRAQRKRVPEPFIWLVFRNLVQACTMIEKCGWYHLDIKPMNIFLKDRPVHDSNESAEIPSGLFPGYYHPVLADFGIMHTVGKILSGKRRGGTPGWFAPEQLREWADGSRLHVFAIGLNIWSLMRLRNLVPKTHRENDSREQLPFPRKKIGGMPFIEKKDSKLYSIGLEDLVRECLDEHPAKRPTLGDVSRRVDAMLKEFKDLVPNYNTMTDKQLPNWWRVDLGVNDISKTGTRLQEYEEEKRRLAEEKKAQREPRRR